MFSGVSCFAVQQPKKNSSKKSISFSKIVTVISFHDASNSWAYLRSTGRPTMKKKKKKPLTTLK